MAELESSYNTATQVNQGYNVASALQIRLETVQILENIELFLRGAKIIVEQDEKTGKIQTKRIDLGMSKANDLGVQAVLNYVSSIINPQVVQGNFPADSKSHSVMYENYIEEVHIDLVSFLVINCYDWEIADADIDVIIDFIMKLVIPFMTRLIDNKERESYESTVRHFESNTLKEDKGGLKLFGNSHSP